MRKFGINDSSIENGYHILCNAYTRKVHIHIIPLIINILKTERKCIPEVYDDGAIYTNAPFDMFKIYSEIFDVVKAKQLKDLVIKMLTII